jgi:hypothetical protein
MDIDRPIFIVGSGRSGTTILYGLMALHPELCWFSNLTARYPGLPGLAALHRSLDVPLLGDWMKGRLVERKRPSLKPSEAGNIYHAYCGFDSSRRMTSDDLTSQMEGRFKRIVEGHLRATGKPRFMNKQTANAQRISVISRMFPDAYYVHIIRDGRAVAYSLLRVEWWNEDDIWWLGEMPEDWACADKDPLKVCALQWQHDVLEILNHRHLLGDRYLEIRYEDLVRQPREVVSEAFSFCGLSTFTSFADSIPGSLPNMNYKWTQQLDESQKMALERTIGHLLEELGYLDGAAV